VNTPQAVHLIDGDDPTLVAEAVGTLVRAVLGDADRSLAVEEYAGDDVDLAVVADGCATPPFLAERRIVVVRDVGRFSAEEVAPLVAYLEDPLPTTVLVLAGGGGQVPARLVAAVKAHGRAESTRVEGRQAGDWLRDRLKRSSLRFHPDAETALRVHLGEDVSRLVPILDLLVAVYGEGAQIDPADLEPYMGEAGSVTPWAFTDAIDAGETETALDRLHRLLGAGDRHPLVVLAILHRHVQSLLRVDDPGVRTEADAAAALGIAKGRSTYPAKKALTAARRWGSAGIAEGIGLLADAEVDLKGASAWPEEAVLEVLVARLCRLARAPGSPRLPARSGAGRQ
jgi:DNA polymerase III subunit delta